MFRERNLDLPPALEEHVSLKKLRTNCDNYREFNQEISKEDEKILKKIQRNLLNLPLVHCSRNPNLGELLPAEQLSSDIRTNTHPFDKSLGLDKYVFLHWGLGDWSQYGQELSVYSTNLLLKPTTIVTPHDALNIAIGQESVPYNEIGDRLKEDMQKYYFDLMLTGKDWLHLITLRILAQLKRGAKMIPINANTFGEIKILGKVKEKPLAAYHGRKDIEARFYGEQMYPNGFIFSNIYDELRLKNGPSVNPAPSPEQIEQIMQAWE